MTGQPVFRTPSEGRAWKRLNGGGPMGRFAATNGAPTTVLEEVLASDESMHPVLLVSLMRHLDGDGAASQDTLEKIVSKSRPQDCLPSIAASMIALDRGDTEEARRLLSMSSRSQEVLHRSVAAARIHLREGNPSAAGQAALAAYGVAPSCMEVYDILAQTDPEGGWSVRQNIQQILDGGRPSNPAGYGRMQDLYTIYYEWFRGSREKATDLLVNSVHYRDKDPEFMLASARMSMDERDWHSARMVYGGLLGTIAPFVTMEAAEAALAGGDPAEALEMMSSADQTLPRVMRIIIRAKAASGDRKGMMDAVRAYLDSEFSDSAEYADCVRMLLEEGYADDASTILDSFLRGSQRDAEALALLSVVKMRAGDYPGAMSAARDALRCDKGSAPARVQKARMYFLMGKGPKAEAECQRVLASDPTDRDALILLKDMQTESGDMQAAAETCRRILQEDPEHVPAMMSLSKALGSLGDGEAAVDMLNRVLRTDGTRERTEEVITSLISSGLHRDALSVCRDAETRFGMDPLLKRLRGNAEYGMGDYLRASISYAEAARMDPLDPVLWHSKGMADEARGDLESAEAAYGHALLLDLDEPEYWISKAAVQEARGDKEGAVDSLNRAIELGKGSTYALVRKAIIFSEASMHREALHYLDMAQVSAPGNAGIALERMREMTELGDIAGAISAGESPDVSSDVRVIVRLSELKEAAGDVHGAVAAIDRGLSAEPDSVPLLKARARILIASGDASSRVSVDRLMSICPEDPEVRALAAGDVGEREAVTLPEPEADEEEHTPPASAEDAEALYIMAESLMSAGDYRGAMKAIDRALAADSSDPDYLALKARAAVKLGDRDGAVFMLSSAMRENPSHAGLFEAMAEARMAGGDAASALSSIEQAMALEADSAELYEVRAQAFEMQGNLDRAVESYSAAFSRDPGRLDIGERLARIMLSRREPVAAMGTINRVLKRDPRRVSAIVLKAEIASFRKDDGALMEAYGMFTLCPVPGPEHTAEMSKIMRDAGHGAEAAMLTGGKVEGEDPGVSVKRNAERALRRAHATKVGLDDPDLMGALGLDRDDAEAVSHYLNGPLERVEVSPGSEGFRRMEELSLQAVTKLKWKGLERDPRLPMEKVFMQCGCKDVDEAKGIVAYVYWAMRADLPSDPDPRLSAMSMRLPKGMSLYEIMRECGIGVYEARVVKDQIV